MTHLTAVQGTLLTCLVLHLSAFLRWAWQADEESRFSEAQSICPSSWVLVSGLPLTEGLHCRGPWSICSAHPFVSSFSSALALYRSKLLIAVIFISLKNLEHFLQDRSTGNTFPHFCLPEEVYFFSFAFASSASEELNIVTLYNWATSSAPFFIF